MHGKLISKTIRRLSCLCNPTFPNPTHQISPDRSVENASASTACNAYNSCGNSVLDNNNLLWRQHKTAKRSRNERNIDGTHSPSHAEVLVSMESRRWNGHLFRLARFPVLLFTLLDDSQQLIRCFVLLVGVVCLRTVAASQSNWISKMLKLCVEKFAKLKFSL